MWKNRTELVWYCFTNYSDIYFRQRKDVYFQLKKILHAIIIIKLIYVYKNFFFLHICLAIFWKLFNYGKGEPTQGISKIGMTVYFFCTYPNLCTYLHFLLLFIFNIQQLSRPFTEQAREWMGFLKFKIEASINKTTFPAMFPVQKCFNDHKPHNEISCNVLN